MKPLFSENKRSIIIHREEEDVYCIWLTNEEKWYYCDAAGQSLPQYEPKEVEASDDGTYTDDPTQVTPLQEGFYGYSTHEVIYHPDGMDGLFGIKRRDGTKVTEEIFAELTYFSNGLCPVRNKEDKWGCVDTSGTLVLPYRFSAPPQFNPYGVAVGDHSLIDREGREIPDTALNLIDSCLDTERYFCFGLISEEQMASVHYCGTAEDIRINVYDTKLRQYVCKAIPECRLYIYSNKCETEVIRAAAAMLAEYDEVAVEGVGTIIAKKDGISTVFDYYQCES